jgi:flagellar motor switch/type III secretory pathway protein FliN
MPDTEENNTALAVGSQPASPAQPDDWAAFQLLSCQLTLQIPVPGFTIAALLRLTPNDVIDTHWLQGSDVPLHVNGKLIGWTEFEVLDDHLAARLTQIA